MRSITPRATPVVRAPAPSVAPPAEGRDVPPLLRAPVSIITPVSEVELRERSLLIGRLPECDVMIDDALVSRMHARLSVRDESVVVEDLHSTNGVYVNGSRIAHSALLSEGDRLLIGTTEISLFEARPDARVAPLRARRERETDAPPRRRAASPHARTEPGAPPYQPSPARSEPAFGELDLQLDQTLPPIQDEPEPPSVRSADLKAFRNRHSAVPSTARADALELIGALAERLVSSGNLDEARRVLSSHLKRILQGATAGLTVPDEVCALASRHALSLARWTSHSPWIDYVVELHLAARRAMSPELFDAFESTALTLGTFDRQLFDYYVESLSEQRDRLTAEERLVLERLLRLSRD